MKRQWDIEELIECCLSNNFSFFRQITFPLAC